MHERLPLHGSPPRSHPPDAIAKFRCLTDLQAPAATAGAFFMP
nr:MAG TPA: hypothetical protein [Caudoviricetes sp.]